jgi:hypothetical protein
VAAVENVFVGASNELGAFESGVAASLLGVAPAIALGGALTMGVVAVWCVLFPELRDVDRFSDVEVPDEDGPDTPDGPVPERPTEGVLD